MIQDKVLVSCIIPSYKRAETLERAINSVLKQTYNNIEIIIVDDNDPGDDFSRRLKEIVSSFNNEKVRYVGQTKHINGAEARNAGVRASKGEYIAFLDDDDEWLPMKLEKQVKALMDNPDCKGVSCLYSELRDGVIVHSCPPYTTENLHFKIFCRQVAVFTSTVLLEKRAFLDFGGFDNKLRRHQDLQMLLCFTQKNKMTIVPEYLVNLHLDSDINRPNLKKLVEIKKDFFYSVGGQLKTYSPKQQKQIKAAHYYELAFGALKERKFIDVVKYFLKAGFDVQSIGMLRQRMNNRKYIAN